MWGHGGRIAGEAAAGKRRVAFVAGPNADSSLRSEWKGKRAQNGKEKGLRTERKKAQNGKEKGLRMERKRAQNGKQKEGMERQKT